MPDRIESFGATPECPTLDALLAAAQKPEVQRHLETCAHCRTELAMFQEFEAAEPRPEETGDLAWVNAELSRRREVRQPSLADRVRAWFTLPRLSMAAVALLVLIVAGVYLPNRNGGTLPGQENPVWRSGAFTTIAPLGDIDHAPRELKWEAVPGAASYHVRVLEVDGTELWSSDVNATSVELPNNTAAKMSAGRAFQWDVSARDNTGRQIASTSLQSFHIIATSH
jgi:hypothetical protein